MAPSRDNKVDTPLFNTTIRRGSESVLTIFIQELIRITLFLFPLILGIKDSNNTKSSRRSTTPQSRRNTHGGGPWNYQADWIAGLLAGNIAVRSALRLLLELPLYTLCSSCHPDHHHHPIPACGNIFLQDDYSKTSRHKRHPSPPPIPARALIV